MREQVKNFNFDHWHQRYQGCFGYLCVDNKEIAVVINQIKPGQIDYSTSAMNNLFIIAGADVEFNFQPLRPGYNPTTKGLYFVQRIPARQWRRGICPDNSRVFTCKNGLKAAAWNNNAIFSLLENGISFRESVKNYETNKYAALSKHFALMDTTLYFYDQQVGALTDNVIKLPTPDIAQELSDVIKRNNYPWSVHVNK